MAERILIIADDDDPNRSLSAPLEERGFEVVISESANDGYRQLIESRFDLVIINLDRPITGVSLVKRIRLNSKLNRLIVLTIAEWGSGQPTLALAQGADAFEPKPTSADRLIGAVEKLLRPSMAMTANASADGEVEE